MKYIHLLVIYITKGVVITKLFYLKFKQGKQIWFFCPYVSENCVHLTGFKAGIILILI